MVNVASTDVISRSDPWHAKMFGRNVFTFVGKHVKYGKTQAKVMKHINKS